MQDINDISDDLTEAVAMLESVSLTYWLLSKRDDYSNLRSHEQAAFESMDLMAGLAKRKIHDIENRLLQHKRYLNNEPKVG